MRELAETWNALAEATQVLQAEKKRQSRRTSSASFQTTTDRKGVDVLTPMRKLAKKEHSSIHAQLDSSSLAVMKVVAEELTRTLLSG